MSASATQNIMSPATLGAGDFVWYELRTTDANAAIDFYTHVVGWQVKASGNPGGVPYSLFAAGGRDQAGVMELTPEMSKGGMRPGWVGFIGVDDVDRSADKLVKAGGKLHCPPQDIPTVGRWASVEDPQGAYFQLFKGLRDQAPDRPPMNMPGTIGWNELQANDEATAWAFYSKMFGWQEHSVMDMGPMGIYRMFNNPDGPRMGAVMTRNPNHSPVPFWLFYLTVEDIDAAVARIGAKGGQVFMGPHEVPGSIWIVLGTDPQGALFALVGPKKQ